VFDVIVRPLFRSLSRPLFRALTGLVSAITKVLIDLLPTSSSFYSLGTPIVYDGDFEVEFEFQLNELTQDYIIVGSADSDNWLRIDAANNGFDFKIDGSFNPNDGTYVFDNKLHKGIFRRIGNVGQVEVDGVLVVNVQGVNTSPFQVAYIAARQNLSSNFFNGIISNVKLTDLDTPANSLEFKLDQLTANIEYPVGNVFGNELVINGDFTNGTANWALSQGGSIAVVNEQLVVTAPAVGEGYAYQSFATEIGETYTAGATIVANTGGSFYAVRKSDNDSASSNTVDIVATTVGSNEVMFTATATTTYVVCQSNEETATFSNISIRKSKPFVKYQNIGTGRSFRETYTLIDDDYFGPQAVVNSDFATDSEWSKGTNVTISGGQAVFASAPNNQGIVQNGVADEGRIFDVTVTLSGYVQGGLQVRNPFEDFTPAAANGVFTFTGIVDNNSVFLRADGVTTLNIDSVTARRRIEVTPQITPVTQEMTLTQAWTVRGDAYAGLNSTPSASVRVDAVISNTDDGILMESGATGNGAILYVYDGVLYFQCGQGGAFGTAANRAETSYTLPSGEFDYIVEWSADTTNAVLYVNGLVADSQIYSFDNVSGSDAGTIGQSINSVAVNRGGWNGDGDGVYTNTITKCDIFNGQVTPDV
jgi:hypothetical protein